jgi:hypothetical protein
MVGDVASAAFMYVKGNFEDRKRGFATWEEECCQARRGNTKDNFALVMDIIAECLVDKGFASSSWTIKEECDALSLLNRGAHSIKGRLLIRVELSSESGCSTFRLF